MRHIEDQERCVVSYSDERVTIPDELIRSEDPADRAEVSRRLVASVTSKAKAWEHEKEIRFLKMRSGVFTFPPDSLVSIYFGFRCRERDVRYVESVVKRSNCDPHYACMVPSDDSYELKIVPDDIPHIITALREIRGR